MPSAERDQTMPLPDAPQGPTQPTRHSEFRAGFLGAALAAAILGGFAIATYLSLAIGLGLPLGRVYPALIQTHGHVQLLGWAGLFIIGVSVHFIPRLASVPIARPGWLAWLFWLIAAGLLLRGIGQPSLALLSGSVVSHPASWLVAASGILEGAGILVYLAVLLPAVRGTAKLETQPAFAAVRPYFALMMVGWLVFACGDFFLMLNLVRQQTVLADQGWDRWLVQCFITLVLLPAAMAHSIRLFPMVLALATPRWPVCETAYAYLIGGGLQLVSSALSLLGVRAALADSLVGLGLLVKGGVLLWFVWQLDVLTRFRPVDRPARFLQIGADRPPTRPGLPDFGEFGRFEWLVYSAYAWLVLAAACESVDGGAMLLGDGPHIGEDPIRHMYLLGFITLLIFGVAARMLPGFLKQKAVAFPALVEVTFWFGNAAAVCRVLPPLLPSLLFDRVPASAWVAGTAFALSGPLGLCAVICLAVNLGRTMASVR